MTLTPSDHKELKRIITIQRTAKFWKGQKAVSTLAIIGVLVWYFGNYAQRQGISQDDAALVTDWVIFLCIIWKVWIRVMIWWNHE